jgi:hypothetical protein
MRIRLTRLAAIILLILLFPFVVSLRLVRVLRRRRAETVLTGSIDGDPLAYTGDAPVLIALWADWATVWQVATRGVVEQLEREFAGRCEFAYVDASARTVRGAYGAAVVPTLILRQHGTDIERFVNVLKVEDVRSAIAAAIKSPAPAP